MPHIWTILILKITHTRERSATEINENENFQGNFIEKLSFFTQKNHRNENRLHAGIYNQLTQRISREQKQTS